MILFLEYCWNCCISFLDLLASSPGFVISRFVFSFGRVVFFCFILLKEECIWHAFKISMGKKKQPSWNALGAQSMDADHQCLDVFLLLFEHCQGNP